MKNRSEWDIRSFSSKAELGECYVLVVDNARKSYLISEPVPLDTGLIFSSFGSDAGAKDTSIVIFEGPCLKVEVEREAAREYSGYSTA